MQIADILRAKGSAVATVTASTTVTGLLAELTVHNIGAMVVVGADGHPSASCPNAMSRGNCTTWVPTCCAGRWPTS